MNKCPYCNATSNPLRFFWRRPYYCPKCGGISVHAGRWMGLRYLIAPAITGLSAGLLRDWLDAKGEFSRNHGCLVFAFVVVQMALWLILIRWVSGRLTPCSKNDQ